MKLCVGYDNLPMYMHIAVCDNVDTLRPQHGSVECRRGNRIGSICQIKCNEGYGLEGVEKATCTSRLGVTSWNAKRPTCIGKCLVGLMEITWAIYYFGPLVVLAVFHPITSVRLPAVIARQLFVLRAAISRAGFRFGSMGTGDKHFDDGILVLACTTGLITLFLEGAKSKP